MTLETDDGAVIFMRYPGVVVSKGDVRAIRTAPRFETGDPRYAWVNQTLFVGKGHALPGLLIEYDVYRVT
jgi:hypothetical protein